MLLATSLHFPRIIYSSVYSPSPWTVRYTVWRYCGLDRFSKLPSCSYGKHRPIGCRFMKYWKMLFSGDITLLVVNAHHEKRFLAKDRYADSEWISTLLRAGLLNGVLFPKKEVWEFRDLNRYRKTWHPRYYIPEEQDREIFYKVPASVYHPLFLIFFGAG